MVPTTTSSVALQDGDWRPLVVRFGALGDTIILLGLIEALHRRFGRPVDVVSSGAWTGPLLADQPAVGNLYLIRSRRTPYLVSFGQRRLVRTLRARAVGPVWHCERERHGLALLRRAGIRDEWIVDSAELARLPSEHHMQRLLRFAERSPAAMRRYAQPLAAADTAAAKTGTIVAPPLHVLPAWRADVDEWLHALDIAARPLVLLQVGNKRTMRWWVTHRRARNTKYWPEERWAALARWLLTRHPDAAVLLLGVPVEARLNDEIIRLAGADARLSNVARSMTVPRLLALQERALGTISVDTGPAHSAAALDCPLVVLFGRANVPAYRPLSRGGAVRVLTGRDGSASSILGITVEDVEEAWEQMQGAQTQLGKVAKP